MKKVLCVVLCAVLGILLCGCSLFDGNAADLLSAPRLMGELAPVQKALEASIAGKYTLKSPRNGEYRSAVSLADLDNDGSTEAVAFYSTVDDNTLTFHVAVIDCPEGVWKVSAEAKLVAAGVDRLVLADLDNDGVCEILVGWNLYTNVDRKVCVYEYTGTTLLTVQQESYNAFCVCDLNDDFHNDLLVMELPDENASAIARYYTYGATGVAELGECVLDPGVTAYYDPVVTKTPAGGHCVLLDSAKGAGLITQVVCWNESGLAAPFHEEGSALPLSYRTSLTLCRDFDGDGMVEAPLMTVAPLGQSFSPNEQTYFTVWNVFDGDRWREKHYTAMNETDGYYLALTSEEMNRLTIVRSTDGHTRTVYAYDPATDTVGEELFSLRCVSQSAYKTGVFADTNWQVVAEREPNVYLYSHTAAGVTAGYPYETVKGLFRLISEVKA